jgi:hypothetical protein
VVNAPSTIKSPAILAATMLALIGGTATAASSANSAHSRAQSATTVLKATLTGKYLHTSATGTGTATITIAPSKICWKFSYSGLDTPNDSGIHIAPPPAAGIHKRSVFPFTATTSRTHRCIAPTKWGSSGPVWLTKITNNPGRFYVIIATSKYPQGAIGGILKRA